VSPRRTRIGKVVTLREQELDKRVAQLSEQRAAELRAASAEEQKKAELQEASESRLRLTENEALPASSWIEANEWLQSRQKRHEQARVETARAQLETRKAQGAVMTARTDLKKVELLSERIQSQEEAEAQKAERRLEDELSALRFRRTENDQ
jgi:flagellar export protein FliJ